MMKSILTAVALAAFVTDPVFAQAQATPPAVTAPKESTDTGKPMSPGSATMPKLSASTDAFVTQQTGREWRASKLVGMTVTGLDNKSIGDINEILLDNRGMIHSVIIGVGGFLGVGEKDVAVPFSALRITRTADGASIEKVSTSYSKDQLKGAPTFKWYSNRHTELKTQH